MMSVEDADWVLLPDFQGLRSDLVVLLASVDGALVAGAAWTSAGDAPTFHVRAEVDPAKIARLLTMARIAVAVEASKRHDLPSREGDDVHPTTLLSLCTRAKI